MSGLISQIKFNKIEIPKSPRTFDDVNDVNMKLVEHLQDMAGKLNKIAQAVVGTSNQVTTIIQRTGIAGGVSPAVPAENRTRHGTLTVVAGPNDAPILPAVPVTTYSVLIMIKYDAGYMGPGDEDETTFLINQFTFNADGPGTARWILVY